MARHNPEEDRRREISRKNSVKKVRKKTGGAATSSPEKRAASGTFENPKVRETLLSTRPGAATASFETNDQFPATAPTPRIARQPSVSPGATPRIVRQPAVPSFSDKFFDKVRSGEDRRAGTIGVLGSNGQQPDAAQPSETSPAATVSQPQPADLSLEQVRVGARIRELRTRLQVILQGREGTPEERTAIANEIRGLRGLQSNIATAIREPIDINDKFDADRIKRVGVLHRQAISLLQGQAAAEAQTAEGIFAGGTLGARQSGLRLDPDGAARLFATASPEERAHAGGLVRERAGGDFPATEDIRGAIGRESSIRDRIATLEAAPPVIQSSVTTADREAINRGIEARRGPAETLAREGVAEQAQIRELRSQQLGLAGATVAGDIREQEQRGRISPIQTAQESLAGLELEARRADLGTQAAVSEAQAFEAQRQSAFVQAGLPEDFFPASLASAKTIRGLVGGLQGTGLVKPTGFSEADERRSIAIFEDQFVTPLERLSRINPAEAARAAGSILLEFPQPVAETGKFSRQFLGGSEELVAILDTTYQRLLAIANAG